MIFLLCACTAKKEAESPKQVEYVDAIAVIGFDGSDPDPIKDDPAIASAQAVLESESPRLKGCYERALEADKTVSGMVEVKLVMGEGGAPKVSVLCTSVPKELTECVVHSFEAMRFDPPPKGKNMLKIPVYMKQKGGPRAPACNPDPGGEKF